MITRKTLFLVSICVNVSSLLLAAQAVPNWAAPAFWSPPKASRGAATLSLLPPVPLVPLTPCRAADTRGNGFVGSYGPPSIAAGTTRTMTLTGVCGVSASAVAVSMNITITDISALGDVRVFPAGGSAVVSTQNWTGSTGTIANAAVVALGTGGAVTFTIDGFGAVDLIVDVNGYYASDFTDPSQEFVIATSSTGPSIVGINSSPSCTGPCGVLGQTASTGGGIGVAGYANGTTGLNYGAFGVSYSETNFSGGVYGLAQSTTGGVIGVQGVTVSGGTGAMGVYGLAQSTTGVVYGVQGFSE